MISDSTKKLKKKIIWKRRRENDERHTHKAHRHNTQTPPPSRISLQSKHLRDAFYAAAFTVQPTQSTLIYVFDDGHFIGDHRLFFVLQYYEVTALHSPFRAINPGLKRC